MNRISKLLAPPVFEGDENKTRAAKFLNTVLWTMEIGMCLSIPLAFFAPVGTMTSRLSIIASIIVLTMVMLLLMRRGHVKLVSVATVFSVWAVTNLAILFGGGGVRSIGFPGNVIVVLIAGVLLGRRGVLGVSVLCILTGVGFVLGRQYGLIAGTLLQDTDQQALVIYSMQLVVAAVLMNLSLRNAEQALAQAKSEIEERMEVQERLRANELFLRAIINNIPFDLWVCDSEDRYILQNAISYRMAGNLHGKTVEDLALPPDQIASYKDKHLRILRGEKISEEMQVQVGGEEQTWLNVGAPVLDGQKILGFVGMNIDLTDYKRTEEELRVSQERFALAMEGTNDGIWDWDLRSNASYVSPRWCEMLGYAPEELERGVGNNLLLSLLHPEDRERFQKAHDDYLEGRIPTYELEFRLRHKDGGYRWILSRGKALWDEQGRPYRMTGSHTDITERKRIERDLQQATLVIENSPVVLFRWRAAKGWPVEMVSQNVIQFGYTPQELLSGEIPYARLIHPDDMDRVIGEVREHMANGVVRFQQEYRLVARDGRVFWVNDQTAVMRDAGGNFTHYEGIVMDTTERKRAEQVQLASHQIAEAALTQSLAEFYNSVYAAISPLIPSRNFYITLYDSDRDVFTTPFLVDEFDSDWPPYQPGKGLGAYVLHTGQPLLTTPESFAEMERRGQVEIISQRMVEWLGVPLKTRQGKIIGVMAVQNYSGQPQLNASHMDLLVFVSVQVAMAIERMQAEAEREDLIRELTAKNTELERFTYTVSHDLKAPLVTINGFLGFLEKDAASGNQERLKQDSLRIREAVNKMQLLLGELLELSRIGRLVNLPESVAFEELAREALKIVQGQLELRKAAVILQPGLPAVYGDRQRLTEAVQNLVDNAAKFMGAQVKPLIEIGQRGEENGKPVFFVRDNGIGIAPEYHERIFGLFNKLDPKAEGTGVGLALVKRIVEVHGGRIWIESEAGKGSTFFFTLPASPVPGLAGGE